MNIILDLIKNNKNWKTILEERNIKIKNKDNLYLFKYGVAADFADPYVCACRGLIIDINEPCIVCLPFDKFFNYHEPYHAEIDWKKGVSTQEKIDGMLMKLYYYNTKWNLASNGEINAEEQFAKLFWFAAKEQQLDLNRLNKNRTYVFELVSPLNQIVIKYEKTEIYHIGTRENETGQEFIEDIGIQKPKVYPLNTLAEVQAMIDIFSSEEGFPVKEGFVIVDKDFHRVKIKSLNYVKWHHMRGNTSIPSKRDILYMLRDGETDEFISYFPNSEIYFEEYRDEILKLQNSIYYALRGYRKYYVEHGESLSALGQYVKDKPYNELIWSYIKDNLSLREIWENLKIEKYI